MSENTYSEFQNYTVQDFHTSYYTGRKVHFCSWSCSESASNEVDWETGWPYEPHFMHDEDLIPYQVKTDKGLIWVNTGNDNINI